MPPSLAVLGLDAADYGLVNKWGCDNLLLENHQPIETFSHSLDVPATLEVWPTIATGQDPSGHGIILDGGGSSSRGPVWKLLTRTATTLPNRLIEPIVSYKNMFFGKNLPQTSADTIFDAGTVKNWPGVTECYDWKQGLSWFNQVQNGEMGENEFVNRDLGNAGRGIGWLASQALSGVPIAGVHIHILDSTGHIYAERPEKLKTIYEMVDELISWLKTIVDHLIIISDHGMQTRAMDDPEPGVHSTRSYIASTESESLPSDVMDVRDWIENKEITNTQSDDRGNIDAPVEHLEDLGYL